MIYDFYGGLLTDNQRQVFEMYYMDNHSLGEIAENQGISRQAVSDLLSRVKKKLLDYEEKVGFMAFYAGYKDIAEKIKGEPAVPASIKELFN
jgi:predicted DNA-binding protein YlxM (UPF0122 family)